MTKFFSLFILLFFSGCFSGTPLTFDIVGTGFKKVKFESVSVYCSSSNSSTGWSGDVTIVRHVLDKVKMTGVVEVPKNTPLSCNLTGEQFSKLSFIPVYNNSLKSRYFRILGPTKLQVRVHRTASKIEGEVYANIVYKKFDHVRNKMIVLERQGDRSIGSFDDSKEDTNWLDGK